MKRKNVSTCRNLRRNQTDAERKLWSVVRNRQLAGAKFRRQFPIGRYILDFYCPEYRLGIEADGGQHYRDEQRRRDALRERALSHIAVRVLRFSDWEILNNSEGVCETICEAIKENPPHLHPLPTGERKKRAHTSSMGDM